MKDSIILQGKTYISARRAALLINYAQDYVGQLCRAGKLDCTMVGRSWFVTEESLLAHRENAIDSSSDRASKIAKAVEAAVAPVVSPIQTSEVSSSIATTYIYESDTKSALPELNKKVPAMFTLPGNLSDLTETPFETRSTSLKTSTPKFASSKSKTVALSSSVSPLATTLIVVFIAVSGLFFALTLSSLNNSNVASRGQASVATAVSDVFAKVMKSLGFGPKVSAPLAANNSQAQIPSTPSPVDGLNGITITPSTNTAAGDDAAKAKIISSFSDEVTILPDKTGTAGVIKPVFKKTDSNDFLYVLVPVKDKDKKQ